jgi:hypothetical protein
MRKLLLITFALAGPIVAANIALVPADAAPPAPKIQTVQRSARIHGVVPGNQGIIDASCATGETVTGGGFRWGREVTLQDGSTDIALFIGQDAAVQGSSQYTADTWRVTVLNTSAAMDIDIEANVMCARITF